MITVRCPLCPWSRDLDLERGKARRVAATHLGQHHPEKGLRERSLMADAIVDTPLSVISSDSDIPIHVQGFRYVQAVDLVLSTLVRTYKDLQPRRDPHELEKVIREALFEAYPQLAEAYDSESYRSHDASRLSKAEVIPE